MNESLRGAAYDGFGEMLTIDVGIYYAEMRVSTSMYGDLVHHLPT